jgi:hypothetical protein
VHIHLAYPSEVSPVECGLSTLFSQQASAGTALISTANRKKYVDQSAHSSRWIRYDQTINSVFGKYGERDRNDASSLKAGSQAAPDNIISSWLNFLVFTLFWQIVGLRRRIFIWKASPVTSL